MTRTPMSPACDADISYETAVWSWMRSVVGSPWSPVIPEGREGRYGHVIRPFAPCEDPSRAQQGPAPDRRSHRRSPDRLRVRERMGGNPRDSGFAVRQIPRTRGLEPIRSAESGVVGWALPTDSRLLSVVDAHPLAIPATPSECGERSAEFGVRRAEYGERSAECGVRGAE